MKNLIKLLFIALSLLTVGAAYAVITIDITAPGRRLPIAVTDFAGPYGAEIADIIRQDLEFTGLFEILNKDSFIEPSARPFARGNWTITGADAVLKGVVNGADTIRTSANLYDVAEGREIFQKQYEAPKELLRPLAHSISGDVYGRLTGEKSIFRTKIAFVITDKTGRELAIADWDGFRIKRLGIRATAILSPHWSSDGGRLIYSALKEGIWGLYILNLREGKERLIHSSKGIVVAGNFLPSNEEFVFSSLEQGISAIYVYSLKEGKMRKLSSTADILVSPSVSPDGRQIAFVSDKGGSPQIYIMNTEGYNTNRLTFEGAYNTSPTWSPKGDRIAFVGRYAGRNQIFTIGADGTGLKRLTDEGNNEEPSFSPDGRFIAFTSDRGGQRSIYIMRADGEGQRPITPEAIKASGARWSPY